VPTLFGNDRLRYVLGKWSGAISVEYHLERMGIQATKDQIEEMLALVRDEARLQKASLSDEQFRRIVGKVLGTRAAGKVTGRG
jgi:isopropylmalate/homocitrate/citramalate synthase